MKKLNFNKIWILFCLLALFSSCKDVTQNNADVVTAKDDTKVTLSVTAEFQSIVSRETLSITKEEELAYYKGLSFDLYAVDREENEVEIFSGYSYEELSAAKPSIKVGAWTFTLNAKDEEKNTVVLTASLTEEISGDTALSFNLTPAADVKGTVEFDVIYSKIYVKEDKEGLPVQPEFDLQITDSFGNPVDSELYKDMEISDPYDVENGSGYLCKHYSLNLPVDKYDITVTSGKEDTFNYLYLDEKLFYVTPNVNLKAEYITGLDMNFVKNEWDKENGKYNYASGFDLPVIIENFEEHPVIELKDTMVLDFSARFDKDVKEDISVIICGFDENDNRFNLAQTKIPMDVKADEFFSEAVSFVFNETDGLSKACRYGMNFQYDPTENLDEVVCLKNLTVEAKFVDVDVVTYTYHQGAKEWKHSVLAGTPYTLRTDLEYNGWCQILNCWKDENGDAISEISAEDNTSDRDFYADASLNLYKNVYDSEGNYNFTSTVYLGEAFDKAEDIVLPEINKTYKVTLTGTPDNDVEGLDLCCSLVDIKDGWKEQLGYSQRVTLSKDKETSITYSFTVPETFEAIDEDYFKFCFFYSRDNSAKYDNELIFKNFKVTAVSDEFENILEDGALKAEVVSEGIKFTITKPENSSNVTWGAVIDTESKVEFNPDWNVFNREGSISFVYPFVKAGRIYNFELQSGLPDNYRVTVKAIGGTGEIDFTEIKTLEPELIYKNNENYLSISKISENTVDVLKEYVNIEFLYKIWSGDKDWNDTEFVCERNFYVNTTVSNSYTELLNSKEINILDSKNFSYDDMVSCDSLLSSRDVYWSEVGYYFTTAEAENVGRFRTPTVKSEEAQYSPATFEKPVYQVSFDSNGGYSQTNPNWQNTVDVYHGDCVPEPDVELIRQGYDFDYWYLYNENEAFNFRTSIKEGIKLTAHWRIKEYEVKFLVDGEVYDIKTVNWNDKADEPEAPAKEPYTFVGWFTENDVEFTFDQTITSDVTLYAKWQAPMEGVAVTFPDTGDSATSFEISYENNGTEIIFTAHSENSNVVSYVWEIDDKIVTEEEGANDNVFTCSSISSESQTVICYAIDSNNEIIAIKKIKISK